MKFQLKRFICAFKICICTFAFKKLFQNIIEQIDNLSKFNRKKQFCGAKSINSMNLIHI